MSRKPKDSARVIEPKEEKITISECAVRFKTSTLEIRRYCMAGMPHEKGPGTHDRVSIPWEKAQNWKVARGNESDSLKNPQWKTTTTRESGTETPDDPTIEGNDKDDTTVFRLDKAERAAWRDYQNSIKRKEALDVQRMLMKFHLETVKNLGAAKQNEDKEKEALSKVWEGIRPGISEWISQMRMMLDAMPRAMAARCNPAEPNVAERVLREWLNSQFLAAMSQFSDKIMTDEPTN